MLFERSRTNWWVVIAGALSGIGCAIVPYFNDDISSGVGSLLAMGCVVSLVLLIVLENQWAGLIVAGMLALSINYPVSETGYSTTSFTLLAFTGVWLRSLIREKGWVGPKPRFSRKNHVLLVLYIGMGFVSLLFQRFHGDSFWPVFKELFIAVGIFAWLAQHKQQKHLALEWMVVFSCGLWIVLVYSLFFSPHGGKGGPIPFFENGNYFSAVLSIAMPFMFWIGWSRRDWMRWLGWAIAGSFLFGIIWFQSRGAWVGLAGGLVFFVWFLSRNYRQRLALAGFLVAGIATLVFWMVNLQSNSQTKPLPAGNIVDQFKSIADTETNFSNRERILRWKVAFRLFVDRPILGVQAGRFDRKFKFKLESMEEVDQISYWYGWYGGAHSEYLTRLAERGLPGTLLFIGYFVWILLVLFRLIKYELLGRLWGACIAFSLGTWLVHGFFNDLSTEIAIWMPLMLISGYIIQMKPNIWKARDQEPTEEPTEKPTEMADQPI